MEMAADDLVVRPVAAGGWDDLAELFERRGPRGGRQVTDGCWCMWWRERTGDTSRNRAALCDLVEAGHEPGLLAYLGGRPVGWVSVGPREEYAQLLRSRRYGPWDDDEGVFSIICFYVHRDDQGQGIADRLLDAAIGYAAGRGAAVIEAYPKDPPDFMGHPEAFAARGFAFHRQADIRTVVRRTA